MIISWLIPTIDDEILGPGIDLPEIQNVDLSQTFIDVQEGFALVQASPKYQEKYSFK